MSRNRVVVGRHDFVDRQETIQLMAELQRAAVATDREALLPRIALEIDIAFRDDGQRGGRIITGR